MLSMVDRDLCSDSRAWIGGIGLSILSLLLIVAGCGGGGNGEGAEAGHEHSSGTSVTIWSDSTELFFEYPVMIAGGPGEPWAVHVTKLADFSPVSEGILTLAFRAPDGQVYTTSSQAPARPGIYAPSPVLPEAGTYDLVMDIEGPSLSDRISAGEVQVYASEDDLPPASEEHAGGISFLKEQQWQIDFDVARAEEREIPYTISVSGEIVPAAGRLAQVSAPVSGLALARSNLGAPSPGERVAARQAMAVLSPTTQDNSYAEARARVERLQRKVERLERLYEAEAIPEKRLVEARHDLEVARSAYEAIGGEGSGDGYEFVVRSPISGVVQQRHFTPGQRVDAGEPLFEVADPSVVWLRLNVPARYADIAQGASDAVFSPEGSDIQYRADRVVSVASSIDSESRTLPVVVAVDNPQNRLKIRQFVHAQLAVGGTRRGVAVPSEAIQQEDGQAVLYVQTGGETFERRPVVVGPTDGTMMIIASGLSVGEFVVTEGAYQVYLASLGTTEIGDHGHPH